MRIGILTFHNSLNCGAALQAWALQTFLKNSGYDASIVNYGKIGWPSKYYIAIGSIRHFMGMIYHNVTTFFKTFGIEAYRRCLYASFMKRYMHLGDKVSKDGINNCGYTHLITGSDQVWHPLINEGDDTYFLANAAPGVKRISYAPSFGVDHFDNQAEQNMRNWISKFDSLSVREGQGAEIVRHLTGRNAKVVCDPTVLLQHTDYEAIEPKIGGKLPGKYIAVYTVCGHPWAEVAAAEMGHDLGIPIIHLLGGQLARWYLPGKIKRITAMGPAEFLWFIHHAEFVVTNSFHGTVFSLLYHKPFVVTLNGKVSDTRMTDLLKGTGAEKRAVLTLSHVTDANNCRIDWKVVDQNLAARRLVGRSFLVESLR